MKDMSKRCASSAGDDFEMKKDDKKDCREPKSTVSLTVLRRTQTPNLQSAFQIQCSFCETS